MFKKYYFVTWRSEHVGRSGSMTISAYWFRNPLWVMRHGIEASLNQDNLGPYYITRFERVK